MNIWNMKSIYISCLIVLLSIWRCQCGEKILFPLGKEVAYQWKTYMNSGTILPSEVISHWNMSLDVIVQQPEANLTVIKITNMEDGDDLPELELPFQASFNNGELIQISTHPEDQPWSRNIKRALVSLLQLKLDFINTIASQSFITQEVGLQGNCKAEYAVFHHSPNMLQVKKMIDVDSCSQKPVERISSSPQYECANEHTSFESLDSERVYTVSSLEGNDVLIQNITAVGVILEQPYQAKAEAHYSKLIQQLSFVRMTTLNTPIAFTQEPEAVEVIYEPVNLDPTFGKEPNKMDLQEKILDLMGEISDSLSNWEVGVKGLDNQTSFQLVDLMWWLEMEGWEELHRNVTLGTSYRQETIQHLFWELVPQVGSEASVLFIKSLVMSGRIQQNLAIKILGLFPFYIRDNSEQLLTQFEEFLKLDKVEDEVRQAAILSFASLLRRTCADNCRAETIDRYAKLYLDQFTESKDYSTQMVYLQGLANMELSQVLEFLIPVITGHDTINRHIRFLASWATLHAVNTDSTKIFEVFWPIFINREQSLEMRVCALTLLIMSKPTTSRFLSIYWYMSSEPSQQLYNFYYTTIHSLASSNYPCYAILASGANKLARYIPPKSRHWSTGNYILDFEDSERGFGGLLQTLLIASQSTGLPNVFMFTSEQHALGYSRKYYLYLKIAGLDAALYSMFYKLSARKDDDLSQVFQLLKKLKVQVTSPEEIHLELIFKVNSMTVYSKYMNRTNFYEWTQEVYRVSRLYLEFSVNHQSVSIGDPGITWYRPSDVGTPMVFLVRSSSLFSARGSFYQDLQGRARNAQLDVRYSWNGVTSLRVYDPLKNEWHGADRTRNLHVRLPFATRLNLHFENSFFNVTAVQHKDFVPGSRLGLVWNSSTRRVSTTLLHKNYPNISDDWSMDSEDLGAKLGASVFDCGDQDTLPNALNLLKNAFMINHKNHHMVTGGVIILALMSLKDQLRFQPTGKSCGVILYLSPLISKVEPVLEVGEKGFKVSMYREDSIVWEIVAGNRRLLSGNQEFTIKLNRAPRVSSEGHWRVLQLEGAFEAPSRDALPQALALSGYAFLSWGDGPRGNSESQAVIDVKVTPARPTPPCTDLVPSCLQAASDLAAIQTASLRYSNLPGWLKMAAHALFPEHIQTESTETQLTFAYPVALLPWNTKGLCAINGGSVLTLDNATVTTTINECFSVAAADCSKTSLFAILVNRVNGVLGAKVYCESDIVRLEPLEGGISAVYVNDTKITNLTDYHNSDIKVTGLSVSKTPEGVIEVELRSGVVLRHYNTTVVALIPARFRGSTCGVCGDFNGDTSDEPSLLYQDCGD